MDAKLTVRLPRHLLDNARRYAQVHHTTLTELISAYLQSLPSDSEIVEHAPIVQRLTGLLSPDISTDDYKKHLEEKLGQLRQFQETMKRKYGVLPASADDIQEMRQEHDHEKEE